MYTQNINSRLELAQNEMLLQIYRREVSQKMAEIRILNGLEMLSDKANSFVSDLAR